MIRRTESNVQSKARNLQWRMTTPDTKSLERVYFRQFMHTFTFIERGRYSQLENQVQNSLAYIAMFFIFSRSRFHARFCSPPFQYRSLCAANAKQPHVHGFLWSCGWLVRDDMGQLRDWHPYCWSCLHSPNPHLHPEHGALFSGRVVCEMP